MAGEGMPASGRGPDATDLVLLAHGSPDPRHAAGVERVAREVRELGTGDRVHTAYLDHHGPSPTHVARTLTGGAVVPLLLTRAHHARVDIPAAAAAMNHVGTGSFAVAGALGPDELLFQAVEELLAGAGRAPGPQTAVLLCVGGSSDHAAVTALGTAAARRGRRGWGLWGVAALAGGQPVAVAAERLAALPGVEQVVAVPYLVADGVLRDRIAEQAGRAGLDVTPGTLGDTRSLARLVLRRAREAQPSSLRG